MIWTQLPDEQIWVAQDGAGNFYQITYLSNAVWWFLQDRGGGANIPPLRSLFRASLDEAKALAA